jgi:hypothetical protein
MRGVVTLFIIVFMSSTATDEDSSGNYEPKEASGQGPGPIVLGVWGNSIVGQALVLLLRGSGYEAKFLPTSSLIEPRSLEGVRLLLLAPTPELSTERRKDLLASLRETSGITEIAVLELGEISEGAREEREQGKSWQRIPWPSKIEDLKRRVEIALLTSPS